MTGTTSIFVIITLLAFVAWWRKRGRLAERRRQWEEEDEPWTESLTDEDVQDIYGDREERWQEDSEREERL